MDVSDKFMGQFCDNCGDYEHGEKKCPNEVFPEEQFTVPENFQKINIKPNDVISAFFEIINLTPNIVSVKINSIKNEENIQVIEERVKVHPPNKISVNFKVLNERLFYRVSTDILNSLFKCEVPTKLNLDKFSSTNEDCKTLKTHINDVKEGKVHFDSLVNLVQDLSSTHEKSKEINLMLVEELKTQIEINKSNMVKIKALEENLNTKSKYVTVQDTKIATQKFNITILKANLLDFKKRMVDTDQEIKKQFIPPKSKNKHVMIDTENSPDVFQKCATNSMVFKKPKWDK